MANAVGFPSGRTGQRAKKLMLVQGVPSHWRVARWAWVRVPPWSCAPNSGLSAQNFDLAGNTADRFLREQAFTVPAVDLAGFGGNLAHNGRGQLESLIPGRCELGFPSARVGGGGLKDVEGTSQSAR
ncbi:MAG: hypothetical protein M0Z53_06095, partial [Thermaerobacter sp.]|nr:hypothetical protein [Thermaerobacter sp.]